MLFKNPLVFLIWGDLSGKSPHADLKTVHTSVKYYADRFKQVLFNFLLAFDDWSHVLSL